MLQQELAEVDARTARQEAREREARVARRKGRGGRMDPEDDDLPEPIDEVTSQCCHGYMARPEYQHIEQLMSDRSQRSTPADAKSSCPPRRG